MKKKKTLTKMKSKMKKNKYQNLAKDFKNLCQ